MVYGGGGRSGGGGSGAAIGAADAPVEADGADPDAAEEAAS